MTQRREPDLPTEAGRLEGMAMMVDRNHFDPGKLAHELREMAARLHPSRAQARGALEAVMQIEDEHRGPG